MSAHSMVITGSFFLLLLLLFCVFIFSSSQILKRLRFIFFVRGQLNAIMPLFLWDREIRWWYTFVIEICSVADFVFFCFHFVRYNLICIHYKWLLFDSSVLLLLFIVRVALIQKLNLNKKKREIVFSIFLLSVESI